MDLVTLFIVLLIVIVLSSVGALAVFGISLGVIAQLVLAVSVYFLFLSLLVRYLHVQSKSEKTGQAQVAGDSKYDDAIYSEYPDTGSSYDYSNGSWGHWSRWRS